MASNNTATRLARAHGASAWSFRRKLAYLSDSLFAFSDLPIRVLLVLGALGLGLGMVKGLIFASAMTILLVLAFPVASVQASIRSSWIGNHLVQGQWPKLVQWVSVRLPQ